jgi:drug/metabolite transporter (DMT)-like permease
MTDFTIGVLAAIGSGAAWAIALILLKSLKSEVSPFGLTLVTAGLGVAALGGFILTDGATPLSFRPLLFLGISGILGITIGDTLFFAAIPKVRAQTMVLFGLLGQTITVILGVVVLGERLTPLQWAGVAITVVGVTLVSRDEAEADGLPGESRLGLFYALLAALFGALSVLCAKTGLGEVSAAQGTFVRILFGGLGLLLFGLITGQVRSWLQPLRKRDTLLKVSAASFIGAFGGFYLFHLALKKIDIVIASPLSATEPLFAMPLALWFLGERPTVSGVMGTALAVLGAVLICL